MGTTQDNEKREHFGLRCDSGVACGVGTARRIRQKDKKDPASHSMLSSISETGRALGSLSLSVREGEEGRGRKSFGP